ncbi:FxSxx-COOH system tetratricopeptide repeat protein [Amycolatopsis sp. MtRt-6]|uniref:FxSxx-COOH system tetratricopeptide repeat protein n=1 Tax=Amycolatopsis sp. MtRt-6 TaxID=2792782 RepID=UPI0027DD45E2|nr:FxSxx-COOH system tetratricopeptide repeat protein [Amycolatopsis sp. MtRt-6]
MSLALVGVALALVGNLATNLVEVQQWWWRPVVFTALGVLVAVVVLLELVRQRAEQERSQLASVEVQPRVFGALPRQAWQWQSRPYEEKAVRAALGRRRKPALVALLGARGAGKSQLAGRYARWCLNRGYDLVAWVNAESGPESELAALAAHLNLPGTAEMTPEQAAAAVCRWLEHDDRTRRLLVFDNVDDPNVLHGYIPAIGTTKVLITTNRREFATVAGVAAVEVGMFTPAEGTAFLLRATGLDPAVDGTQLGEQLGWLPLGLAQAAAFIARTRLSYAEYAELLRDQNLDEMLRQQAGADHPGVLKATQLSLAGLADADPSGDAARLLRVLSVLSPDGVSRDLLMQAEEQLDLRGAVWPAINALVEASLVTISGDVQAVSYGQNRRVVVVHRLTALVVRHEASRPPAEDQAAALDTATRLLGSITGAFPSHQVALRRGELDELTAHLEAVRGHVNDPSPLLLIQADWIGRLLEEAGDLTRALPLLEQNLESSEQVWGAEHPNTVGSRNNLAQAYASAGRLDETISMFERTVAEGERLLGDEHPNTLIARNNLAGAYELAGRFDEAISLHERTLADRVRILGAEHPHTLISRNNLAYAYVSAGRFDEAISLHERTLADRERILGVDHRSTLISRNNLADAYVSAGRLDEAISLHERTLADRERILGAEHPDTLTSWVNLARAYQRAGQLEEAIRLYEQTLTACQRLLGPAHHTTETARLNLAFARAARTLLAIAVRISASESDKLSDNHQSQ